MKTSFSRRIAAGAMAIALVGTLSACAQAEGEDLAQSTAASEETTQAATSTPGAPTVDRNGSANFPEVTGAFGENPQIAAGVGSAPTNISVRTLSAGSGSPLKVTDTVIVNYALALWDGTKIESSFDNGAPTSFSLQQVIPGWTYGLETEKVGSRVEIVVPAEYGYGDNGTGNIPGGSTLVFVVDILASSSDAMADEELLSKGTPTGNDLPEGILVEGKPGQEPTLSFDKSSKGPQADSKTTIIAGAGEEIKPDDSVLYWAIGGVFGDSSTITSMWNQPPMTVTAQQAGLDGGHVGDRVLVVMDTGSVSGEPSMTVMLIDLVGVMRVQ